MGLRVVLSQEGQGHAFLTAEEVEEAIQMVARGKNPENPVKKSKREDRKSLPSCMGESMNYILECIICRNQDRRRAYLGETSNSPQVRFVEGAGTMIMEELGRTAPELWNGCVRDRTACFVRDKEFGQHK